MTVHQLPWRRILLLLALGIPIGPRAVSPAADGPSGAEGPEGIAWRLLTLGGLPEPTDPTGGHPSLFLDPARKEAGGSTGCNRFSGGYELVGASLQLGPLRTTRRACADVGAALETRYLEALAATREWRIEGGDLVLSIEGDELARFRRDAGSSPSADLETLTLRSTVYTSGPVTLTHGGFRAPVAPGAASQILVELTGQRAFTTRNGK